MSTEMDGVTVNGYTYGPSDRYPLNQQWLESEHRVTEQATESSKFASWAVLELMGHRRLGGFVSEATLAGGAFLRIDIPGDAEGEVHSSQFYSPASVYCLTPCSEEAAKIVARSSRPQPVHTWELPAPEPIVRHPICDDCGTRHNPLVACDVGEKDNEELAGIPF